MIAFPDTSFSCAFYRQQDNSPAALKQLWSLTYREAQVQTFADAFLAIGVCLAIATVLVPLLRKVATPSAPSADAH